MTFKLVKGALYFMFFWTSSAYSQTSELLSDSTIYEAVELRAEYEGGEEGLMRDISRNVTYPLQLKTKE